MTVSGRDDRHLHALAPDRFLEEVHTFQFWFDAVEGYLPGTSYGRHPETQDQKLSGDERERLITALCNYLVGETAALEGASGLIALAPSRMSKIFLATQVADEARHVEVFMRRLAWLDVEDPELEVERRADPNLLRFKQRLLELVGEGDWDSALFAQNVILEAMEFAVFRLHAQNADPVTRELLDGVLKDERRHIGFGENELGRRLQVMPEVRLRIRDVRQELDRLVLSTFDATATAIGVATSERNALAGVYLDAVRRLGVGD
jgi:1,2-phenylacetyl-CoA epoxidase catalytic subunit